MMDLPLATVVYVLVWHVLSWCGYRAMRHVILLHCFKNLHKLALYKFLKLTEDDTEVSKHVRVNII
jgi:hypothetical protein